ncbi:MAG: ribosome maturation factor RimM [Actinomycetota bacterium]|nr:MAG: ribosome maturation factor RimM [Actinomycetota bacterium]
MRRVVGRIGRPHGVGGEVTVEVRTDEPDRRFTAGAVLYADPPERGPLTVGGARWHSGRLLLTLDGVSSRGAAEALRDTLLEVEVEATERPADPEEYYDHQLVGLRAVTASGDPLGTVAAVVHLPGQDLLAVDRDSGGEVLIPFVTALVPVVDLAAATVTVDAPPGLLETGES